MTTPLELHALKQLSALSAAELLTSRTVGELWAVATLCKLRLPRSADKADLVAAILAATHPRPAPVDPAPEYTQERFV